jgi:hypothetical protein
LSTGALALWLKINGFQLSFFEFALPQSMCTHKSTKIDYKCTDEVEPLQMRPADGISKRTAPGTTPWMPPW